MTLGLAILLAALGAALIDAGLRVGDRRRCEWANVTGGEE